MRLQLQPKFWLFTNTDYLGSMRPFSKWYREIYWYYDRTYCILIEHKRRPLSQLYTKWHVRRTPKPMICRFPLRVCLWKDAGDKESAKDYKSDLCSHRIGCVVCLHFYWWTCVRGTVVNAPGRNSLWARGFDSDSSPAVTLCSYCCISCVRGEIQLISLLHFVCTWRNTADLPVQVAMGLYRMWSFGPGWCKDGDRRQLLSSYLCTWRPAHGIGFAVLRAW